MFHNLLWEMMIDNLLPLDCNLPPAVIHVMECKKGPSSKKVVKRFNELIQFLNEVGFEVNFRATDGDISFDHIHDDFFYKTCKSSIESIIRRCYQKLLKYWYDIIVRLASFFKSCTGTNGQSFDND